MNAPKVILVVLATVVIFASGVVTGGLLVRHTQPPPVAAAPPPPGGPGLFAGRFDAVRSATDQLGGLTPDQRAHIDRILRDSRERVADFFLIFEPDIQGVFRKMREDIRAELTPEQRRQMEEIMTRQRLRRLEERGSNPPWRPGDRPFPGRRPMFSPRDGSPPPGPASPADRPPPP